jgi:hypothetical protein
MMGIEYLSALLRNAGTPAVNAPWGARTSFMIKLLIGGNRLCLCIPDSVEECVCGWRHGYVSVKNAACRNVMPVDGLCGVIIAAN